MFVASTMVMLCLLFISTDVKSGWDCQQNKETKEWDCKSGLPKAEKTTEAKDEQPSPQEIEKPIASMHTETEKSNQNTVSDSTLPRKNDSDIKALPVDTIPAVAKQPGWSCKSDEHDSGWNCSLVGPDPAGKAHPVAGSGEATLGSATFSNQEELIFNDMLSKTPNDPWAQCTSQLGPPAAKISNEARDKAPMVADANFSDIYDKEILTFSGNVDVTRLDQRVLADRATYNTVSKTLNARGNVHYRDQDLSLYSDSAYLNLDNDQARMRNTQFIYGTIPARGRANLANIENKSRSQYFNAAYTTCAPRNQDWTLEAGTLRLDREEGIGTATNAWLEASGVPVFYSPYLEFPIDNRRKSGILVPSFGLKNDTGFDLSIPYYWNIAPNYDATITPRIMSRRGPLLGGEFRYLFPSTQGKFNAELIPYDFVSNRTRGAFSALNTTIFKRNLRGDFDINLVSDDEYLDQIGNAISINTARHLRSQANLRYNISGLNLLTRLESFQTIDQNILDTNKPYRRLPQILATGQKRISNLGGRFSYRGEYVYFQRNNTVTGSRIDLKPNFSWPIETAGAYIDPKVALNYTQYFLSGQESGTPSSISRILPVLSLDSGLTFERDFTLGSTELVQTLEPRIFYLYVPFSDQDDIPLFDTSEFDFTILQLFRDNRFNSADRFGDANQLSVALNSRILEPKSGRQRLDATLGTIVYFDDRKVQRTAATPTATDQTSSIVAELNGQISNNLSFRSGLQWNPYRSVFNRGLASVHYEDEENRIINLAYRYRQNSRGITEIDQADGSFRLPIANGYAGVGRWQYSFLDNQTLESFIGIEKESCCWRFRIIGRYWIQTSRSRILGDGNPNTGVFAQLELKGFTSFGDSVDRFLERNISGYVAPK